MKNINERNRFLPVVLTVAGSDSGGGAGVQADLRTFNALKVYGCSVITAVTAQNPDNVRRVEILSAESVREQFEAVLEAMPVRFVKTGMLGNCALVECVAEIVQKYDLQLIVDPVMISTSGVRLLEESAISMMREKLFPTAEWLTPNIPEAEFICCRKAEKFADFADIAVELYQKYKCNIILKSGHALNAEYVTDIVCYNGELFGLSSPKVNIKNNTAHGTGCTLSAALTAALAGGGDWKESLIAAKSFVYGSLYECAFLSESLSQMYPPMKSYKDFISLRKI